MTNTAKYTITSSDQFNGVYAYPTGAYAVQMGQKGQEFDVAIIGTTGDGRQIGIPAKNVIAPAPRP